MEAEAVRTVQDLQRALAEVKTLSGLLPMCSVCKKIRNDHGYWEAVEHFIEEHSEAEFSHGICPSACATITRNSLTRSLPKGRDRTCLPLIPIPPHDYSLICKKPGKSNNIKRNQYIGVLDLDRIISGINLLNKDLAVEIRISQRKERANVGLGFSVFGKWALIAGFLGFVGVARRGHGNSQNSCLSCFSAPFVISLFLAEGARQCDRLGLVSDAGRRPTKLLRSAGDNIRRGNQTKVSQILRRRRLRGTIGPSCGARGSRRFVLESGIFSRLL